jgi:hypothetical protein
MYGDINDDNWLSQTNSGGLNLPINNQKNNQDININKLMNMQNKSNNMFGGQIMMNNNINNNINILNNINNNNNINSNKERNEISQQSNTNYSQYTLGKKIYSVNCSNNDSNAGGNKNKDININLNNSNKNINQIFSKNNSNEINSNVINNFENNNNLNLADNKVMTPKMNNYYSQEIMREQNTFNNSKKINYTIETNNNYSNTNPNLNKYETFNQGDIIVQKEDKATQTENDEKISLNNNSQIQSLNIIINEQSKSIESLQNKVNNLEELLAKVNLLLKQKKEKEKNNLDISNDNNIENENDNDYLANNKSESSKNSGNNSKENVNNNKNNISNLSNNIKGNNSNMNNKINDDISNDNLYKIKNCSNLVDSNNRLIVGGNKNILANEDSSDNDNDLSSDLNVSDSRNSKDLNKSNNIGDKTIEIPKIKYNSTLLNSNNDETENDISSN